jgi:hypothetical protein
LPDVRQAGVEAEADRAAVEREAERTEHRQLVATGARAGAAGRASLTLASMPASWRQIARAGPATSPPTTMAFMVEE